MSRLSFLSILVDRIILYLTRSKRISFFSKNSILKITSIFAKEAIIKEYSAILFYDFDEILTYTRTHLLIKNFSMRD